MANQNIVLELGALADRLWPILRKNKGLVSAMADGWIPSVGSNGAKILQAMASYTDAKFYLDDCEIAAIKDTAS